MAEIFRAKTQGLGGFEKIVVIKRLHERLGDDDDFVEMMIDEAKIAVRLNHPNIANVFDLGEIDGRYFIVMEYIEGPDLSRLLEEIEHRRERLPIPAALRIGSEVCAALEYAHTRRDARGREMRIVHRDVSPPNIMLSTEGEVKLVDFGIAKARKRVQQTQQGMIKGKFQYMAPEQARGSRQVDPRTDVFSMGMVLYEMLGGVNPYDGVGKSDILKTVRMAEIPSLQRHRPALDPELDSIVTKALARKPANRWGSAHALEEALRDYMHRKCEPFDRRRVAEFVRSVWERIVQSNHAETGAATAALAAGEYEASESSVLFDAEAGRVRNARSGGAESEGDPFDENAPTRTPFDEDDPTEVWEGSERPDAAPPPPTSESKETAPSPPDPGPPPTSNDPPARGDSGSDPDATSNDRGLPPPPDGVDEGRREGSERRRARSPSSSEPGSSTRTTSQGTRPSPVAWWQRLERRIERYGLEPRLVVLGVLLATGAGVTIGMLWLALAEDHRDGGRVQKRQGPNVASTSTPDEGSAETIDLPISSTPTGAKVVLDGTTRGRTPYTLSGLEPGRSYELALEREGHTPETRTITPSKETDPITIDLDERDAVLKVSTYPTDAEIRVDGDEVGYSPVTVTDLSRRETYEVVATLDDRTTRRTVEWSEDDDAIREVRLQFDASDSDPDRERHARRESTRSESERRRRRRSARTRRNPRDDGPEPSSADRRSGTSTHGSSTNRRSGERSRSSASDDDSSTRLDIWNTKSGDETSSGGEGAAEAGESGSSTGGSPGFVSVQVKQGWGKVYVDGKQVASETPLLRHQLESGPHRIKVYYPVLKRYSNVKRIDVQPGKHEKVIFSP
jgi:serine/threonine-protein kinase